MLATPKLGKIHTNSLCFWVRNPYRTDLQNRDEHRHYSHRAVRQRWWLWKNLPLFLQDRLADGLQHP